jgi:RING finger protein 113A
LFFIETGFCGYGDSCIFLHDRGDYKTGWQLEKEWEEAQKSKTQFGASDANQYAISSDDDSDEELPFACLICREVFDNPVVTRCNHYFCEKCALKNYQKSPKCFACGAATQGVFNSAKNMLKKLEKKKSRQKQQDEQSEPDSDGFIEGLESRNDDDDSDNDDE